MSRELILTLRNMGKWAAVVLISLCWVVWAYDVGVEDGEEWGKAAANPYPNWPKNLAATKGTGEVSFRPMGTVPPEEYRGDKTALVHFVEYPEIPLYCGETALACAKGKQIAIPNPCNYMHQGYAEVLCHELGHVNGWRHGQTLEEVDAFYEGDGDPCTPLPSWAGTYPQCKTVLENEEKGWVTINEKGEIK